MVQHLLLTLVAAPLLLLSNHAVLVGLTEIRADHRRPIRRAGGSVALGTGVVDTALSRALHRGAVGRHQPRFTNGRSRAAAHYFEHLVFFSAAILFWWPPARSPAARWVSRAHGLRVG
jgi:cytochrome c oxidase assembly factor CtaG